MRKIISFIVLITLGLSISCSGDDNGEKNTNSELRVTVDGVQKVFNTIEVQESTEIYEGEPWEELTVIATINNNPNDIITFQLDKGLLDTDAVFFSTYKKNGKSYSSFERGSTFIVQINSNNKIKGSFEGEYSRRDNITQEYEYIKLTDGSFDISY